MANPFVHCELSTPDVHRAQAFYRRLFDWEFSQAPGMDYFAIRTGAASLDGGIQPLPAPGAPVGWTAYVKVKDVKRALARAQQLGATVVLPFTPIGELGAIGIFVDPTGATLGVHQPKPRQRSRTRAQSSSVKR